MELSLNRLYFDGITNNLKDQDEKEKKNQKTSSNEDDVDFAKALSLLQAKAKEPCVISSLSFAENGKTKNTNELFSASVEPSNKEVIGTVSEEDIIEVDATVDDKNSFEEGMAMLSKNQEHDYSVLEKEQSDYSVLDKVGDGLMIAAKLASTLVGARVFSI
ncbi:MAG: hypothetical protein II340_02255 [Succinivibrio sp.]|nr:hypothetical protein [Succinivibrio sp.]